MSDYLKKANRQLKLFAWFKVPLIAFCNPKITELSDNKIVMRIKLNPLTRNHLGSMYLGALTIGADLAAGFHAFHLSQQSGRKVSLAFKNFKGEFHSRPNSAVYFVANYGDNVQKLLGRIKVSGERETIDVPVEAYCNYLDEPEHIATFSLGLSLKDKGVG
ncbi:MAG: DUF4442 domain-containing protein [Salibacteraceae bacterium]|nr:DUF4442 domain-containing protein [Salibacteraceae bacterium]